MADTRSSSTRPRASETASERQASAVSGAVRQVAGEGSAFTQDMSEKTKATAEATTHALEQTRWTAVKGAADFNRQWLEIVRVNTGSALEFMNQLAGAKSPAEFFEVSAAHYRRQLETFAEQTQQLVALAQRVTTDSVGSVQTGIKSALSKAA